MEVIVEENVSPQELEKVRKVYEEQINRGAPSSRAIFDYALYLIRSSNVQNQRKGIALMEDLYQNTADEQAKRDYLFYIAVGHTRRKNYDLATRYAKGILAVEPQNHQARQLVDYIDKKMRRDGLLGMAVVGGAAALVVGGIAALGVALAKK